MGREHILAKKRTYLLVQGTSDFHRENSQQVVMGEEQGGACSLSSQEAGGMYAGKGLRRPWQGREGVGGSPRPVSSQMLIRNQGRN